MSIKDASPGLLPSSEGFLQPLMQWHGVMEKSLLLACLYQCEWLAAWQRALGVSPREYVDQWICRFGGGVPLDG